MLSYALLLTATASCCWPEDGARRRLRIRTPHRRVPRKPGGFRWRRLPLLLAPPAVLAAYALVGIVAATGALALVAAVGKQFADRLRTKSEFAARRRLAEALRTLVAELRAGAHPAAAAEAAATDAAAHGAGRGGADTGGDTAAALRTIAATARLGGEPAAIPPPRGKAGPDGGPVEQIGRSWALAQRHGLPLAEVLEALREDVEGRTRFAANAHAGMAGARASAAVLAALPIAGLALGQAMGADPLHVLAATGPGQVLLGMGCALISCGLVWSARLTRIGVRG